MPPLVETGTHHLRLATQAVRVLHAIAVDVRRADRAACQQVAIDPRGVDLSAMAAHRMNARIERRVAAEARIDRHRARDERGGHRPLCREQSGQRQRRRHLRAVEKRQALPWAPGRWDAIRRSASACAPGHDVAVDARFAFADQHGGQVRERRQIPRRADRTLPRNARHDAGVRQVDQQLDHLPAHARVALAQRRGLERDDQAHDLVVEQRACARAVRAHQRALQFAQPRAVDARARQQPESRIDAVDGAPFGDDPRHGRGGRVDTGLGSRIERQRRTLGPDAPQVGQRQTGGAQRQGRRHSGRFYMGHSDEFEPLVAYYSYDTRLSVPS